MEAAKTGFPKSRQGSVAEHTTDDKTKQYGLRLRPTATTPAQYGST